MRQIPLHTIAFLVSLSINQFDAATAVTPPSSTPVSGSSANIAEAQRELLTALENGDLVTVRSLVRSGTDPNTVFVINDSRVSSLLVAVFNRHASVVEYLLFQNANPDFKYLGYSVRDIAEAMNDTRLSRAFRLHEIERLKTIGVTEE